MEILIMLAVAAILFGSGYAVRGFIGRELRTISAELKSEFIKLELAVRTKL